MFWRLSFRQPSAIDTLLDKEECTLGEILDEDDVLQECKTHNKKLIDFLVRPDILEELVKLVCQEPGENVEDKVKFKYPHIACELLTAEVFTITEQLSCSEHLLGLLWSFLNLPAPLNPLVGSFISKVLAMLLNKEATVIFNFMRGREDFLSQFLVHLGTSAIMDLLLQMVAVPENDQCRLDIAVWLKEQGLVQKLIDLIGRESDSEHCANASQALCDMFILSRESYQKANPSPLHETLESEDTLQRLLDNMFCSESPPDIVIVNGILVLLTALERRRPTSMVTPPMGQSYKMNNTDDEMSMMTNKELTAELEQCLSVRMKDFHGLLERRPQGYPTSVMHTTAGALDPPLGNTRLQVVRLFAAVLQCGSASISGEVIRLKSFTNLIDLFFQYPWNNFLHKEIETCVNAALNSAPFANSDPTTSNPGEEPKNEDGEEKESENNPTKDNNPGEQETTTENNPSSLRHHLLSECKLVCKILAGFEQNERLSSETKGRRQGYMGHLIRITNSLVRYGEGDESLRDALKSSLDEDTQQQWNNFINGPIADLNKRNETNLGGNPPLSSSGMDDSDEEFDQLGGGMDSELEKAYQQYQDVKYVNQFMDDCGVEDELNPMEEPFEASFSRLMDIANHINADEEPPQSSAMFEAACQSRIQQFDDSDESEEEDESSAWADKEVSFRSPLDQHSGSSDEDEDFIRRREFQTGSSDDEDSPGKRSALYMTTSPGTLTQITSTASKDGESDKMEIGSSLSEGLISWHSELSTDAELSGTNTGINWITEPMSGLGKKSKQAESPSSNWADFSSAFPGDNTNMDLESSSPQDMDLDAGPVSSHITVTYNTRVNQGSPSNDDDIIESPEHRPNKATYSLLSPSGGGSDRVPDSPSSPLDMDTIQVAVESSSDDEANSSSDSDEERSGRYELNTSTSSDGDPLLQSPGKNDDSPTKALPSQHDPSSPNGGGDHPTTTPRDVVMNSLETTEQTSSRENTECGSREDTVNSNENRLGSSEVELQDNYSFLAKQGMLSGNSSSNNNSQIEGREEEERRTLEQARAEAKEACNQWEQQVQPTQQKQDKSLET